MSKSKVIVSIALRRVPPFRLKRLQPVHPMMQSFYRPQACPTIPTQQMRLKRL